MSNGWMDFEWNDFMNKRLSSSSHHSPNAFNTETSIHARSWLCFIHTKCHNLFTFSHFFYAFITISCADWVFIFIWSFARFHIVTHNLFYSINDSGCDMICERFIEMRNFRNKKYWTKKFVLLTQWLRAV